MANYGGRRNERDVFVRGFDRWRVPLTIDGVRIYLPADNRLDMNRFLTPDLAEIQIEKGYVSVLNGPGGMGGAINLVSRKPTKPFEAEARFGATFDGDLSGRNSFSSYGMAGTRQDTGYAQISGTIFDLDHWNLSDDFTPTAFEDGGYRDGSETRDWRINAKVGYTPNATDEYAVSYTSQSGEKGAPLHILGETQTRYWTWPYWDINSLATYTHTKIGEASYIKSNAYYNELNNSLRSFDNITHTTQSAGYAFDSWYDDYAYGGMVEFGTNLIPMNTLKVAAHYRLDNHVEHNFNRPTHATMAFEEPLQETEEKTWSIALENTFHATKWLDIVGGVSRDHAKLEKAEEFSSTTQSDLRVSDGRRRSLELAERRHHALRRRRQGLRQRFRSHALPDHLRALLVALRHGGAKSGPQGRRGDKLRVRLERHVLQQAQTLRRRVLYRDQRLHRRRLSRYRAAR